MELARPLCQNGNEYSGIGVGVADALRSGALVRSGDGMFRLFLVSLAATVCLLAASAAEQTETRPAGDRFERRVAQPVSVTIRGRSLRETLRSLAREYRVAVMLDRRLDGEQNVDLVARDVSLRELFDDLAGQLNIGVTVLGPVVYFGPPEEVRQLRTVLANRLEDLRPLSRDAQKRLLRPSALRWDALSTPRDIFADVAQRYRMQIDNPQFVAHDLWTARELPPLDAATQLTLLGAGFHTTFEFLDGGKKIRLVPIPSRPTIERIYSVEANQLSRRLRQLAEKIPQAQLHRSGSQIRLRGRIEDHEVAAALLSGESKEQPSPGKKNAQRPPAGSQVYSLKVEAPLRAILSGLSRQVGFKLQLHSEAIAAKSIDLDQIISVDVQELPLRSLLKSILEPARLDFRQEDGLIEIFPDAR